MRKITVFIEGGSHTMSFDNSLVVMHDNPTLFVKTATVLWNYSNIFTGYNDHITYSGTKTSFEEGYWGFNKIVNKLKDIGITLTPKEHTGKCKIYKDQLLNQRLELHSFGELLGFEKDTVVNSMSLISPKSVNINNGLLLFFSVSCDKVDDTIDTHGKRTSIITTLPIPQSVLSLKGSITSYVDIESRVPLQKGIYNEMTFKVHTNNGHTNIGSVLLDLYII